MRAVVLDEGGLLELRDVPEPEAAVGQVVVDVRAAGVNYADVLIREGRYPQPPPLPYVPGSEVAGETADGRRVIGFVRAEGGGYAERAVVDGELLFDLPSEATYEEGAAFLLAFLTAWMPLRKQAPVREGSRVLVTAAAGGVGSAGVQVARALGGDVTGAVGSAEKLERVRSLGADAVTYEEIEGLDRFDVILDQVGGDVFASCIGRLQAFGTLVGIGFAGGAWQPVDPAHPRRAEHLGGGLLPRPADEAPSRPRPRGGRRAPRPLVGRRLRARRRCDVPARRGGRSASPRRGSALDGQGGVGAVTRPVGTGPVGAVPVSDTRVTLLLVPTALIPQRRAGDRPVPGQSPRRREPARR